MRPPVPVPPLPGPAAPLPRTPAVSAGFRAVLAAGTGTPPLSFGTAAAIAAENVARKRVRLEGNLRGKVFTYPLPRTIFKNAI